MKLDARMAALLVSTASIMACPKNAPSIAPPTSDSSLVEPPPDHVDACRNGTDGAFNKDAVFSAALTKCHSACGAEAAIGACFSRCFHDEGMTVECADCWGRSAACGREAKKACPACLVSDPTSAQGDECRACLDASPAAHACLAGLQHCSGLQLG